MKLVAGTLLAALLTATSATMANLPLFTSGDARPSAEPSFRPDNSGATPASLLLPTDRPQHPTLRELLDNTPVQRAKAKTSVGWGQIPLTFEANQGQTAEEVRFLARGPGYAVFLTPTETVLSLRPSGSANHNGQSTKHGLAVMSGLPGGEHLQASPDEQQDAAKPVPGAVIRMKLEGANSKPGLEGVDRLSGTVNYFRGNDPAKWRTGIPTWRKVHYKDVYPGIDHVYYGNPRQLEHDFIVAPGADPGHIRIAFEGLESKSGTPALRVTEDGHLALSVSGGEVLMHKPHVYQVIDGRSVEVAASYVLHSHDKGVELAATRPASFGFKLATYDRQRPVVIDPVIVYSTYLGGSSTEGSGIAPYGSGIAVDGAGNAYVTGLTHSADFPKVHAKYPNLWGSQDAFVFKLSADGQTVIYSTYLGGSNDDSGQGIAVDGSGNAYVTGFTHSADFPKVHAKYPNLWGWKDAFVFKLSADGQTVLYSTYLGGGGMDDGRGIAVDGAGNAYVTGLTTSADFPTVNAKYPNLWGSQDAFVFKLSADGQTVIYSTYLGGSNYDYGQGIAVDGSGNAYVTGLTLSADFPKVHAKYPNLWGSQDAFVFKLSADGQTVLYSTYLGGSSNDYGQGIAVDGAGNAHVAGVTFSSDFPTVHAKYPNLWGSDDAFVFKLSADGQTVLYSTYLGGSRSDEGRGIAVDSAGNAYVTGLTTSADFPTVNAKYPNWWGGWDAFVFKLSGDGQTALYSTYLGGGSYEQGGSIAVDGAGNAYVTGVTHSADFPTVNAKYPNWWGGWDAFVVKIGNSNAGKFADPTQTEEITGVLDRPIPFAGTVLPQAPLISPSDTRKRNVIVLVHGWNSNKSVWAEDTKTIIENRLGQNKLCDSSNANPCWDVLWADWEETANTTFPLSAWVAASDVGAALAQYLENTYGARLNHLHLVAHSAGSNVIQHAASKLEDNKRKSRTAPNSLHMTFLDPYTPVNAGGVLSYGNVDNSLIPTFSDSYKTAGPSNFMSAVDPIAHVLTQETNKSLLHAYNIEIGGIDADTSSPTVLHWAIQDHAWPYQFYQCSANPGAYSFSGAETEPCPVGYENVYAFGFPLSQETGYASSIQALRHDYRPGRGCVAVSPALCLDFAQGASQVVSTAVQTTVDAAQATASATGRAVVWVGNQALDLGSQAFQALGNFTISQIQKISLFSGSPVWVRLPVTITEPANYLRFDFSFTQGTEGYLQVFIHGKRIYSANQRFFAGNTVWHSPEIGIGDLEPGTYEIALRLDPLSDTQSVVDVTNLSVGRLEAVALPNQAPLANAGANRTVRLGSLVTLDGSASSDPDNAPLPLSHTWTQSAGPSVTLNGPSLAKPSFTPSSAGTYGFDLLVSDSAANSDPATVVIKVPKLGDIDGDGDVDNNDLNLVLAARNKPASGPNDLRDLDGNMTIDALDARKLTTLCTRPRCATQ